MNKNFLRLYCALIGFIIASVFANPATAQFQIVPKQGLLGIDGMEIAPGSNYFLAWYESMGICVVWDMRTGQEIQLFKEIKSAKFASNGENIYLLMKSGEIKLVDINGKTISRISQQPIKVTYSDQYHFFPENALLIVNNNLFDVRSGFVRSFNYAGQKAAQRYNVRKNILVIPDNTQKKINIVQLPGGEQTALNVSIKPAVVELSPSGEQALLINFDTIQVIKLSSGVVTYQHINKNNSDQFGAPMFDSRGENLIYTKYHEGVESIVCRNIASDKIVWKRDFPEKVPAEETKRFLIRRISPDGKLLLAAHGEKGLYEFFDIATGATVKEITSLKRNWPAALGEVVSNHLPIIFRNHKTLLNLETGVVGEKINYDDEKSQSVGFGTVESFRKSFDRKFEFQQSPMPENAGITCQNNGGVSHTLTVKSIQSKKITFARTCKWIAYGAANTQNMLALQELPENGLVNFYNYTNAQKLFSISFSGKMKGGDREMIFSSDDSYLLIQHDDGITIFDINRKRSYNSEVPPLSGISGFTPDRKYAVIKTWQKLKFLELASGKFDENLTLDKIQPSRLTRNVAFNADGRYMFYIDGSEPTIKVFDRKERKEVASVYSFISTNDWAVVSPSGLFEANKGAQNNVYYSTSTTAAPLSTVFEQFYTPRLLPRILSGEKFQVPDIDKLAAIPTTSIQYSEGTRNLTVENEFERTVTTTKQTGTVTVKADCPTDKIAEIKLYHNGKLAGTARNLVIEDEIGQKSVTKTFNVTLTAGDNIFNAVAVNSQRSESKPVFINAKYKPESTSGPAISKPSAPALHLVIVGINIYKNSKYNLNYAAADASSFKTAIESGAKEIFSAVNTYYISDNAATKEGIRNALEQVKQNASGEDLFLFYYAGHGVLDDKKEFYLVPHDVTQLYGNNQALSQLGISSALIQQYSKDIKAQKQLFILDACQSAGALTNAVALRGVAEEKAIAQLARSTGTHWLTASGSDQFAMEFSQLGHGSFTYCLLQALKGEADNGDKRLTVKEIDSYLQNKVPEITQKHKGVAQYPASFGYGNDFPIVIIK